MLKGEYCQSAVKEANTLAGVDEIERKANTVYDGAFLKREVYALRSCLS